MFCTLLFCDCTHPTCTLYHYHCTNLANLFFLSLVHFFCFCFPFLSTYPGHQFFFSKPIHSYILVYPHIGLTIDSLVSNHCMLIMANVCLSILTGPHLSLSILPTSTSPNQQTTNKKQNVSNNLSLTLIIIPMFIFVAAICRRHCHHHHSTRTQRINQSILDLLY